MHDGDLIAATLTRNFLGEKRRAAGTPNFQYLSQTKRSLRWQSSKNVSLIFFELLRFCDVMVLHLSTKKVVTFKKSYKITR